MNDYGRYAALGHIGTISVYTGKQLMAHGNF